MRNPPLRLRFEFDADLPVLAWCAHLHPGDPEVRIHHGSGVEVRGDSFFEGAWAGDFEAFDPLASPVLCGTGGGLREGRVCVAAGTDRQSPIFSIRSPRGLVLSNSPMFAMVAAGEEPDPIYPFYTYDLLAFWRRGLHYSSGALRLASGRKLHLYFPVILQVDAQGRISFDRLPESEAPTDFESYQAILRDQTRSVLENAAASGRVGPRYQPLAAISRGYDSTATATLASQVGCREAVTFFDRTCDDPYADVGTDNARLLGMRCTEHDRFGFTKGDGAAEREMGWTAWSAPVAWSDAEQRMRGSLLITGRGAEHVWTDEHFGLIDDLAGPSLRHLGMLGQSEFRLRIGYVTLAPATIGTGHSGKIHAISKSEEMEPWSLDTDYDRPIPRRIAEEGGIPRGDFGTHKMARGHVHLTGSKLFSVRGAADYQSFVEKSHASVPWHRRVFWRAAVLARHALWRWFGKERRRPRSSPLARRFPFLASALRRWMVLDWSHMFTLSWGFAAMRGRYEKGSVRER